MKDFSAFVFRSFRSSQNIFDVFSSSSPSPCFIYFLRGALYLPVFISFCCFEQETTQASNHKIIRLKSYTGGACLAFFLTASIPFTFRLESLASLLSWSWTKWLLLWLLNLLALVQSAKRRIPPRVSLVSQCQHSAPHRRRIPWSNSQGLRYIVVLRYPCDFVILHIPQHFHIRFFSKYM